MNENLETKTDQPKRGGIVAGAILLTVGLLTLAANIFRSGIELYLVLGIGLIFLVASLTARQVGLLIPAGVLIGIGSGIVVAEAFGNVLTEDGKGGLFMLFFSLGWMLISLLSLVIPEKDGTRHFMWWPLIPGGIMAVIGGMILQGETGLKVLGWISQGWPVVLIGIGLYLLLRRKELKEE